MNRFNKIECAIFVSLMCSLLPKDLPFRTYSSLKMVKIYGQNKSFTCISAKVSLSLSVVPRAYVLINSESTPAYNERDMKLIITRALHGGAKARL